LRRYFCYTNIEIAVENNLQDVNQECDGMKAIATQNNCDVDGQLWEIECAQQEGVLILSINCYNILHGL
jgi:hypothetical protein